MSTPSSRRYLTFSLRTLFILLTLFAVWTATLVNRAREQRDAVKAIEALGGGVMYDWMLVENSQEIKIRPVDQQRPRGSEELRNIVGDDFFQYVEVGQFPTTEAEALESIPRFQQLWGLKKVIVPPTISAGTLDKIKAALPNCNVITPYQYHQ